MHRFNVFDFDGTIYDGDSSVDFFLFALRIKPWIILLMPYWIFMLVLYVFRLITLEKFKSSLLIFLRYFDDIEILVGKFWKKNKRKLKNNLINEVLSGDAYIISASPEFLVEYVFREYKNVKVIGTIVDVKNGKVLGKNCRGEEKIRRLSQVEKKYKIEKFYSDSIVDKPLAKISEEAFIVDRDNIREWNDDFFSNKREKRNCWILFGLFFIFYLVLGILLSYNYDFTNRNDLLFDGDAARVIGDYSIIDASHGRVSVHPLFLLLFQPIILLLTGFTQNNILAIVIFSAFIGAVSVVVLYKFIYMFNKSEKLSLVLGLIFGFSFANVVFNIGIELYNVAGLFLLLLWYYVAKILKDGVDKNSLLILFILGIFNIGITVTNYFVFLIASFILLLSRKISFKNLFFLNVWLILSALLLNGIQFLVWPHTSIILDLKIQNSYLELYHIFNISIDSFLNIFKGLLANLFVSSPLYVRIVHNPIIDFKNIPILNLGINIVIYFLTFLSFLKNIRKDKLLKFGLILTFIFNFALHLIYGNNSVFLYALHFLYLFFVLLGISVRGSSKFLIYIFYLMLLAIVLINFKGISGLFSIVASILIPNVFRKKFSTFILIIIILLNLLFILFLFEFIVKNLKKIFNRMVDDERNILSLVKICCSIIGILFIFVTIESAHSSGTYWFWSLANNESEDISDNSIFEDKYAYEMKYYNLYKDEYKNFLGKYEVKLYSKLGPVNYYFFGMGNRRKMIFKEGFLVDLESSEIVEHFPTKRSVIIPNLYTVLIETIDGEFLKIVEDGDGVFIIKNGEKRFVNGTDKKIDLYTFEEHKYQNILKVLYSEILFNIKDGKIYPNILVYDKPWYRDAAMVAMVLDYTGNVSLIEDWLKSIESVYDYQNHGIAEPDNLGQLLYLSSLVDNKKLQEKVINEAMNIARNNNINHLTGKTDFEILEDYQNAWFQFGMKSIGRENIFDNNYSKDKYSATIWWNGSCSSIATINDSSSYPYLGWAQYHCLDYGKVYANSYIYPLSWEANASEANYKKLPFIGFNYYASEIAPTHSWMAAEMLLFLLDETK